MYQGQVPRLASEVLQEVGIDLVGDSRIRSGQRDRPNCLGGWQGLGRRPGRRVVPESAVFEDLANGVALVGFDEGDDPLTLDTGSGTAPIVDMGAYEYNDEPACNMPQMDTNGYQHVDAIDFDAFSACYNGPTNPPRCN